MSITRLLYKRSFHSVHGNNMKNYIKHINTYQNNRAFTLIETMIAIFILVLMVNASLVVITQSLFAARYVKNEIVSNYLIQEAIDYIRNDRDTIAFQQKDLPQGGWQNFKNKYGSSTNNTVCFSADGCDIDIMAATTPKDCSLNTSNPSPFTIRCQMLKYDAVGTNKSFYSANNTNGTISNIKRQIKMSDSDSSIGPDELDIYVKVEWFNGSTLKSKVYRTSLLNWQL